MPLYEYRCSACGEVFEKMQKFSDQPLKVHDKCGGPVQRLISAPAFHFKGSGWYVTDYARSGASNGKSGAEKSKSTTDTAKTEPAKSETKASSSSEPSTKS